MSYKIPKNEQFIRKQPKDFSQLIKLKDDYKYKPVIAIKYNDEPRIILETFTKYYKEIVEFLVAIGEPIVRTKNFQEYEINEFSLYSAASMGIDTEEILIVLENISKNFLQEDLKKYIIDNTQTYGITRIILKNNRYFIKCKNNKILEEILKIQEVKVSYNRLLENERKKPKNMEIEEENYNNKPSNNINNEKKEEENIPSIGDDFIEIFPQDYGLVREACKNAHFPLLEEFDFKSDKGLELKITPKFKSPIRGYQEKALNIMCNNGIARSGVIVLPCGAGKTLVGILTICTIKRNTIIICNNNVSVQQWYREINDWVNIIGEKDKNVICRFTSNKSKRDTLINFNKQAGILITSYTMIYSNKKRNEEVQKALDMLQSVEWGLMIIDEVQLLPSEEFSKIIDKYKSHCKLGLTATLVREDKKIIKLQYLIGPKHYEANWLDLQKEGFLARVKCIEIWSEMHPLFYEKYLSYLDSNSNMERKKVLYLSNPTKYLITLMLLKKHKGDKIIIFSDNLFTIERYNKMLEKRKSIKNDINFKLISGKTGEKERESILSNFKQDDGINILLMTKVGDISIDIPNANVIIQVSSHYGSRMQEAQRFGRILRPKKDVLSEYNAFFYTIISKNTEEMKYSIKRHRFLVNQGYYFNVITNLEDIFENKSIEESRDIVNKFENDSNYNEYINSTINLINKSDNFQNDYDENLDSYEIQKRLDEDEFSTNIELQ